MTSKQKEYIEFIEEYTNVPFVGNVDSNEDISAYIRQNARNAQDLYQQSDSWGSRY